MYKRTKTALFAVLLIVKVSFSGFALAPTQLGDLQRVAENFSSSLAESLPLNASLGLNWSDAHIGKLFPGLPPSFGIGVSAGFTTLDMSPIIELADLLGFGGRLPNIDRMPFPGYTAEVRIGGLFLPFDIGFKFGYLPPLEISNFDINYFLIGGDIRYAVLNRPLLPIISIGVGFNYMRGGIGGRVRGTELNFVNHLGDLIELEPSEVNLTWRTYSLDFRAQISKSFLIVTPYLGVGASYSWSRAGYEMEADISGLSGIDMEGITVTGAGVSSDFDNTAFNFRVFGGIAFNLVVFRLDFTGMYSFLDNNFGASLGFRFQL